MSTLYDNDKNIQVYIYQGESLQLEQNIFIGKLTINYNNLPKNSKIEIRFSYDTNGILEVEATIVKTGEHASIIIENNTQSLSKEEIEKSIEKLSKFKINPRNQEKNRYVLNKLYAQYQETLGNERQKIHFMIKEVEEALSSQDNKIIHIAIDKARELLKNYE